MTKGRLLLALPTIGLLFLGCSKYNPNAAAEVSGKITYNGTPVTGGTIMFQPAGAGDKSPGGAYPGTIMKDGSYRIAELPAGELIVTIETESLNPDKKSQGPYAPTKDKAVGRAAPANSPIPGNAPKGPGEAGVYVKIPEKYKSPSTTPEKRTLKNGKNEENFDLKD